jgi:hypothetical protein
MLTLLSLSSQSLPAGVPSASLSSSGSMQAPARHSWLSGQLRVPSGPQSLDIDPSPPGWEASPLAPGVPPLEAPEVPSGASLPADELEPGTTVRSSTPLMTWQPIRHSAAASQERKRGFRAEINALRWGTRM